MPARHSAVAVVVAVVWGVNFVVIDVGLDSFPPLLFVTLRFALLVVPAIFFLPRPRVPLRWVLGVGLFISAGQFAFVFEAIDQGMPAGLASLVLQLQAVFTIALGVVLLGERPGRRVVCGAALALAGIAVIAAGRAHGVPLGALLLCVAGAASWGMGNICTRRAQAPNALALLVWSSVIAVVVLGALSLAIEGPGAARDAASGLDLGGVLALLYVVVLSTFFGFGVWTWLMREHPVASVAPFTLLVPVAGIASAWAFLGERPTATELAGGAIVLAGLSLTSGAIGRLRGSDRRRQRAVGLGEA